MSTRLPLSTLAAVAPDRPTCQLGRRERRRELSQADRVTVELHEHAQDVHHDDGSRSVDHLAPPKSPPARRRPTLALVDRAAWRRRPTRRALVYEARSIIKKLLAPYRRWAASAKLREAQHRDSSRRTQLINRRFDSTRLGRRARVHDDDATPRSAVARTSSLRLVVVLRRSDDLDLMMSVVFCLVGVWMLVALLLDPDLVGDSRWIEKQANWHSSRIVARYLGSEAAVASM